MPDAGDAKNPRSKAEKRLSNQSLRISEKDTFDIPFVPYAQ
jgi:hypothetical protein